MRPLSAPKAYRKSRYSKKFFEEHRDELMIHKAAKQAFDQLEDKNIPSRQALHEEFNQLLVEKKHAYAEYRQVKKDMQEYLIAKQTVEHILGIDRQERGREETTESRTALIVEKEPRSHSIWMRPWPLFCVFYFDIICRSSPVGNNHVNSSLQGFCVDCTRCLSDCASLCVNKICGRN